MYVRSYVLGQVHTTVLEKRDFCVCFASFRPFCVCFYFIPASASADFFFLHSVVGGSSTFAAPGYGCHVMRAERRDHLWGWFGIPTPLRKPISS
jgi:hypothetical protein